MSSHCNIPIFIPQKACPHQCIYCNQNFISGHNTSPVLEEVKQTIEQYLSSVDKSTIVQVAFFGGTFTGLPIKEQENYLKVVQPYITQSRIKSIRLSTRPDYIDKNILDMLRYYGVEDIELGAQSLDDEVLSFSQRGHTSYDIQKASELINSYGFRLGLQMMIGLPKDSLQKSLCSAQKIIDLNAKTTRIYPTLVIANTPLEKMYYSNQYTPLNLEQAISWTKAVYNKFVQNNVKVLRVGLHPSKDLVSGRGYIAGPFHISFFELVLTDIWKERLKDIPINTKFIKVNPRDINYAIGYKSQNINYLRETNKNLKIMPSPEIERDNFKIISLY